MATKRSVHTYVLTGVAATLTVFLAFGQAAAPARTTFEYRIVVDVTPEELVLLAGEEWEFAGYLGTGVRGNESDETLWRRPRK